MRRLKFLEFENIIIDALSEIPESNAKKCLISCFETYETELLKNKKQSKKKSEQIKYLKEVLERIKFQLNFIVKRDLTEEENKINKILEYAGIKEI